MSKSFMWNAMVSKRSCEEACIGFNCATFNNDDMQTNFLRKQFATRTMAELMACANTCL